MDQAIYSSLSRISALKSELSVIANNIANLSTTGYRQEALVFSEYITSKQSDSDSISMTDSGARLISDVQGSLFETGGSLDFAIEGEGYFQLEGPSGPLLSRAGSFALNSDGEIVNHDGFYLLDQGGGRIALPAGTEEISLANDGTLTADGAPIADVGVFLPTSELGLERAGNSAFKAEEGLELLTTAALQQGFLEASNVNPLEEVARMIEVQRRYESAKSFTDREHQRIKSVLETLGR